MPPPPQPVAAPTPPPQPGVSAVDGVALAIGVPDLVTGRRPAAPPLARLASEYGQVEVRRTNFLPRPVDGQPFFRRMLYREAQSFNPSALPLESKVAHRADPEIAIAAHSIVPNV